MANQCCVCKGRLGFFDTAYKIAEECDDHLLCEFCYGVMQEIIEAPSVEDYQKKRSHFNRLTQDPGTPRSIIDRFDAIDIEWKRKETVSLEKEREKEEKKQLDHKQYQKYLDKIQYLFTIPGCRGRTLTVCKNKCIITTDVTLGSLATGNATDGEKMIFFKHCSGLQFKESGFSIGYLQFETPSMQMNNQTSNFFSENTFTFQESDGLTNKIMRDVFYYVMELIENCASGTDFEVPEYPEALEKYLNPAKDILKRN